MTLFVTLDWIDMLSTMTAIILPGYNLHNKLFKMYAIPFNALNDKRN